MAIEGVERLEEQVDQAEAGRERAEAELRAKVTEAVEARGRAARSEEALKQLKQIAASRDEAAAALQREGQAREAKLREEINLAKREIEMMQEMVGAAQGQGESAASRVEETLRVELRQEQQRHDAMGQAG